MVQPAWGLSQGGGFQNALAQGLQFGQMSRQRQDEKEYKNALAQFDPSNPETLKPIMQARPEVGIQLQGQVAKQQQAQQEAQRDQQEQRRADLPLMGKLLNHAKDEASYQQARQIAAQYGVDTSQLPPNFDPQWIEQQRTVIGLLQSPEGKEILSTAGKIAHDEGLRPGDGRFEARVRELAEAELIKTIPYQPGGNVVSFNPRTGTTTPLVQGQNVPSIAQPVPYDPNQWEEVGGAGGNASGGFPGN